MKTWTETTNKGVAFRVSDVPENRRQLLADDYYLPEGDDFVRYYPADDPNVLAAAPNFAEHGVAFLRQTWADEPAPWKEALAELVKRIEPLSPEWLLTGSCPLALRGIDVAPRGVDVIFAEKDFEPVRRAFADIAILPIVPCGEWVAAAFGVAFKGAQISMAFGCKEDVDELNPTDSGPYALAHAETLEWEGHPLRVTPLQLSLNINLRRGRTERAEKIRAHMDAR